MNQPRILIVQDISLSCRISMNVALPVLSCLGNWVNILPTALLSAHTGIDSGGYTFLDLSNEMEKVLMHWRSLGIKFDGMVIGYLGSLRQIQLVEKLIIEFMKEDGLVVLDPVMGDDGQLYEGFTQNHVKEMRKLSSYADILIPNQTEAYYLAGIPYESKLLSESEQITILSRLTKQSKQKVVLTGATGDGETIGAVVWSAEHLGTYKTFAQAYPGHFDGTGDLFTSVVAGFLFQHYTIERAVNIAVHYVSKVVARTIEENIDPSYGVVFEKDLAYLMGQLTK